MTAVCGRRPLHAAAAARQVCEFGWGLGDSCMCGADHWLDYCDIAIDTKTMQESLVHSAVTLFAFAACLVLMPVSAKFDQPAGGVWQAGRT